MTRPFRLTRVAGPAAFLSMALMGLGMTATQAHATPDDHKTAQAALTDLKAASALIVAVEDGYSTDPAAYHGAAQRAINILVGQHDPQYVASAGQPDDETGAIGQIDLLLARDETSPWVSALRGAEINIKAAVARLQTARTAHELMDFQVAASQALTSLGAADGRTTDAGVFGGLEGALATTELGVPDDAHVVNACDAATSPGWGVHNGYLGFVALAPGSMPHLAEPLGVTDIVTNGNVVVLRTAAWPLVSRGCTEPSPTKVHTVPVAAPMQPATPAPGATTPGASPAAHHAAAPHPAAPPAADHGASAPAQQGALPALYTLAQARAGQKIYATQCVSCHGADLHGVAAPAVAGTEFLQAAKDNDWTLQVIRYLVTTMMPLNAGGSLPPDQYAEVMAFLLASNCLPAGSAPFPTEDQPDFAHIQLAPFAHPLPHQNALGVCSVQ